MKDKFKVLTSFDLRIIAIFLMLIDHMWASVISGNMWMTYVGRLAFPIFAFLIVEGFHHTSDLKQYKKRLFIFALISEIPFDLFTNSSILYPFGQNVMFTLLLGLITIELLSKVRDEESIKANVISWVIIVLSYVVGTVLFVDHSGRGVLTVVAFYLFRENKLLQLISMVFLNFIIEQGFYIPIEIFNYTFEFYTQGFAVLALPIIWLYNGQSGNPNKIFKWFGYVFYPVHMFILYLIMFLRS